MKLTRPRHRHDVTTKVFVTTSKEGLIVTGLFIFRCTPRALLSILACSFFTFFFASLFREVHRTESVLSPRVFRSTRERKRGREGERRYLECASASDGFQRVNNLLRARSRSPLVLRFLSLTLFYFLKIRFALSAQRSGKRERARSLHNMMPDKSVFRDGGIANGWRGRE